MYIQELLKIGTRVEVHCRDGQQKHGEIVGIELMKNPMNTNIFGTHDISVRFADGYTGRYFMDQLNFIDDPDQERRKKVQQEIDYLELEKLQKVRDAMYQESIVNKILEFITILADLTYWKSPGEYYIKYRGDGRPLWWHIDNGDKIIHINKCSGGIYCQVRLSDGAIIMNDSVELYLDDAINNPSKIKSS
jgi:hypothetical protein